MTNKLVVIINSLKVPKIKKILLYKMKFLVPNYSCLQNPWLGSYHPQFHFLSVLNWICWTPPWTEFLGMPLSHSALAEDSGLVGCGTVSSDHVAFVFKGQQLTFHGPLIQWHHRNSEGLNPQDITCPLLMHGVWRNCNNKNISKYFAKNDTNLVLCTVGFRLMMQWL